MNKAAATQTDAPFVFLSYARDDARWAEALANTIERQGLSVWWDRRLRGGEAFSDEIERALRRAGAVLVVWSEAAKHSRWVLDEAGLAADRGVLVPVALANVDPPIGFRQVHTIPFSGGPPERDPALSSLLEALSVKLGAAVVPRASVQAPHRARWPLAAVGAGMAMAAAAIVLLPRGASRDEERSQVVSTSPVPATKSVAVLPFRALSSGSEDGYFADGVTEEVINALGTVGDLRVTGRTSAFAFKRRESAVKQIAQELGVAHIVEGSVRRSGDSLRVSARLVRASDGFQLWQATYDRAAGDPFDVQSDIAANVAKALEVVMDDHARRIMANRRIANVEAFIAFQKGFELYQQAHGKLPLLPTLRRANAEFNRTLELAPQTSDAYLLRADLPTHLLWSAAAQGELPPDMSPVDVAKEQRQLNADLDRAYRTSTTPGRRLQLDFVRAIVSDNWAGLKSKLDATLGSSECVEPIWLEEMNPYGNAARIARYYEHLVPCDPLSSAIRKGTAFAQLWSGKPQLAVATSQRLRAADPDDRQLIQIQLSGLLLLGRYSEVRRILDSDPILSDPRREFESLRFALLVGDERTAKELQAKVAGQPGRLESKLVVAAWSGDRAAAIDLARRLDAAPMGHMSLLYATMRCLCGAPFPIEATPKLKAQFAQSGFTWPPRTLLRFPKKTW